MKKILVTLALAVSVQSQAQGPITIIIQQAIKKVIVELDLKIQKLQNKTIRLQNAQKAIENTMSKLRLDEIKNWMEKQRKLYADYFDELKTVKLSLTYFQRVKDIIDQQVQIVKEYRAAWALFKQDRNFTGDELGYMQNVYTGMMDESSKNVDQLVLVIDAFVTQMTDAKRLEIINTVAVNVEQNFMDLKEFNEQNKMISLQRATEKNDIEYVKKLYGL
jgi:hypothetical protein